LALNEIERYRARFSDLAELPNAYGRVKPAPVVRSAPPFPAGLFLSAWHSGLWEIADDHSRHCPNGLGMTYGNSLTMIYGLFHCAAFWYGLSRRIVNKRERQKRGGVQITKRSSAARLSVPMIGGRKSTGATL
jgi:hypothetical protein